MNIFPGHISFLISHGSAAHCPFRLPSAARINFSALIFWLTQNCNFVPAYRVKVLIRTIAFYLSVISYSFCHQLSYLFVISCRRK